MYLFLFWIAGKKKKKIIVKNILRDTLRLPAEGWSPSAHPADWDMRNR
jgi:hypothetical protein